MSRDLKIHPLWIVALMLACSCTKSLETTYNNQEAKIDSYITSQNKGDTLRVVHNKGSHRLVLVEGEGEELSSKGTVAFYYAGYTFKTGVNPGDLFITNHQATAESASWTVSGESNFDVYVCDLSSAELLEGLRNGLQGVKAGEECMILFSGKHAFAKKSYGVIPRASALAYHIWVESVNND